MQLATALGKHTTLETNAIENGPTPAHSRNHFF